MFHRGPETQRFHDEAGYMYATTFLLTGTTLLQPGEGPYMHSSDDDPEKDIRNSRSQPTLMGTSVIVSFPKMSITFTATVYRPGRS